MEARKITVIETKNQRKSVIMSAATTLAELKNDLRANNIDYNDMTFFEGTAKVELKSDNAVLPHDVPYKGTTTNELVFMLTNTNKKIKSGTMSRLEVYNEIKKLGLQDACIKKFGKNFTMCKTADLIALIQSDETVEPVTKAEAKVETKKEEKVEAPVNTPEVSTPAQHNGYVCVDVVARAAISKLVEILEGNGAINELKRRYKQVFICLDNDEPGLKDAQKLSEETGFTNVVLPKFDNEGKDISDAFKLLCKQKWLELITPLFTLYCRNIRWENKY